MSNSLLVFILECVGGWEGEGAGLSLDTVSKQNEKENTEAEPVGRTAVHPEERLPSRLERKEQGSGGTPPAGSSKPARPQTVAGPELRAPVCAGGFAHWRALGGSSR